MRGCQGLKESCHEIVVTFACCFPSDSACQARGKPVTAHSSSINLSSRLAETVPALNMSAWAVLMVGPIWESCQEKECYRNQLSFTHISMCVYASRWIELKQASYTDTSVPVEVSTKWQGLVCYCLRSKHREQFSPTSQVPVTVVSWWKHKAALNFPSMGGQKAFKTSRLIRTSSAPWVSLNPRNSSLHYLFTHVTLQKHTAV